VALHITALAVLVVMFVVASVLPVNLGLLALVAAFVVGAGLGGMDVDDMLAGFPADLLVLLVGVTYLFGVAQVNGTLERVVDGGLRLVRGRVALVPWLLFLLTAFVAAVGALSAAAVAIMAPIAMRFAQQYRISPLLVGLMVVQGATAGSFSPLSPFGAITGQLVAAEGLPSQQPGLFLSSFVFNVVMGAFVFWLFGGVRLARERRRHGGADGGDVDGDAVSGATGSGAAVSGAAVSGAAVSGESDGSGGAGAAGGSGGGVATVAAPAPVAEVAAEGDRRGLSVQQVLTLAGLGVLVVAGTAFGLDVGFTALAVGLVLTLVKPSAYADVVSKVPWSAVLLVCGVITYVGVLESVGTIDFLSDLLTGGTSPLVAALAAAYIGGLISAFASTAGVLGASIPLAAPLLDGGVLPVLGTISAIGIASSVVDVSPLSTNGALLVANQRTMDSRVFFRKLLVWSVPVIAVVPLIAWLVFVVLWP